MAIILLFIGIAISTYFIQSKLKSVFEKYRLESLNIALTGKEVAEKMLKDNGIYDVKVMSVEGELTDHYNPIHKTVNLSKMVYTESNISSAAIAAHECGHAVQHSKAYAWLNLRSQLVPVVDVSSRYLQYILMGGILLIGIFPQLLLLGIILFALTTLFAFITLPVEYDASRRALAWLSNTDLARGEKFEKASIALNWAARTYVVAAIASLSTLIYYVMIYMGGRKR